MENPGCQVQTWLKKELRRSASSAFRTRSAGSPLVPSDFTKRMQTPPEKETKVDRKGFSVSSSFSNLILVTTQKLPHGTAAGKDNLYYEMFQADPYSTSRALASLWRACGRLNGDPTMWNEGILVPLHKKGDVGDPANYRPICLLSAARKILERAIDREIQNQFIPHQMQVGFQSCLGTDIPIMLTQDAITSGNDWAAVLDLEGAYDTVPRDKLIALCEKELEIDTVNMVTHLRQPLTVYTIGDTTDTFAVISIGVTQGGPASPGLFNIYINPLAIKITAAIWKPEKSLPGRFYADDVILLASQLWELIGLLLVCEKWAAKFGMRWSLSKKKSQLLLHPNRCRSISSLPFAGGRIHSVSRATYLGIQLISKGISPSGWVQRDKNAQAALQNLSVAKLIFPGVDPQYAKIVFRVFIESIFDYTCFATPIADHELFAIEQVYARFFAIVLGIRVKPKQTATLRLLFRMDDRENRNQWLALKFRRRIETMIKSTELSSNKIRSLAQQTAKAIANDNVCSSRAKAASSLPQSQWRLQLFQKRSREMKRPVFPHLTEFPVALRLPKAELRSLAVKWHLGVFPTHVRTLQRIGYAHILEDLKLLSRAHLTVK